MSLVTISLLPPWVVALMVKTYMLLQSQVWGMVSGDPASSSSAVVC